MTNASRTAVFLLILILQACSTTGIYNVRTFGARGNGRHIDSPAINKAIRRAADKGGGTVFVPAGDYLCYSIQLRSNVNLHLDQGATILSAPVKDGMGYDLPEDNPNTQFQGFGHNYVRNSLIWGLDIDNAAISGFGRIDGSNLNSWNEGKPLNANKAIGLRNCRNVSIKDITIYRGGHFAIHATGVENMALTNLRIDTDRDGIDIICCRNVSVTGCMVNCPQDDAIVLKSNYAFGRFKDVEDITVTGCLIYGYQCGSMLDGSWREFTPREDEFRSGGRIKLGTESSGGYKNIAVSNCVFEYCGGLMLQCEDGGDLEDVTINNITMRHGLYAPIFIRLGARMRSPEGTPVGHIRRVQISNLNAWDVESWNACTITGIPGHHVEDITLSNIHLHYRGGYSAEDSRIVPPEFEKDYPEPWMFGTSPARGFFVRHARNITFDGIYMDFEQPDGRKDFVETDCEGIVKRNVISK